MHRSKAAPLCSCLLGVLAGCASPEPITLDESGGWRVCGLAFRPGDGWEAPAPLADPRILVVQVPAASVVAQVSCDPLPAPLLRRAEAAGIGDLDELQLLAGGEQGDVVTYFGRASGSPAALTTSIDASGAGTSATALLHRDCGGLEIDGYHGAPPSGDPRAPWEDLLRRFTCEDTQ